MKFFYCKIFRFERELSFKVVFAHVLGALSDGACHNKRNGRTFVSLGAVQDRAGAEGPGRDTVGERLHVPAR